MANHINVTISGDVQGVGFRWGAKQQADTLGIAGFVRNEKDGSLYLEAEGSEAALKEFSSWCQKGPFWARVDKVVVQEGEMKNFSGFSIIR